MERKELRRYLLDRYEKDDDGCWVWTKAKTSHGYGCFKNGKKTLIAHKESYRVFVDPVPKGLFVCHHCDNRACIKPSHLFLGTAKDNYDDMITKGRQFDPLPQYGNNYRSKKVMAAGIIYSSYCAAARALNMSDNGVRKRIKLGWEGYMQIK